MLTCLLCDLSGNRLILKAINPAVDASGIGGRWRTLYKRGEPGLSEEDAVATVCSSVR